jgi:hypothetical protein
VGEQATSLYLAENLNNVRILILGDTKTCERWILPALFIRYEILPLLEAQRRETLGRISVLNHMRSTPQLELLLHIRVSFVSLF